ncbi:MAG: hypothetical protein JXA28_01005, partial [Bacteroidetes bacterium]|nr:hypothetical protein [Bacteroidota bacterium]
MAVSEDGEIIVASGAWDEKGSTYHSTDGGVSWIQRVATYRDLTSGHFREMMFTEEGTLLAAEHWRTISGQDWLARSTDKGRTWIRPRRTGGPFPCWYHNGLVQDATGRLYCGSSDAGLLYSTDDGQSWNPVHPDWKSGGKVNAIVPQMDGSVFVCANVLYHFADTSLCSWSVADSVSFDDMLAPFPGIMLGGNVTGVYRSDESGQHWSPCMNGIHAQQERSLFVDREDLLWYAGAVSTDHGRSWDKRICSGNAYHFFSDADGWYYAWHYSPAPYMFRSADGRNWQEVTTLPLRQPIYGMKQAGRWLLCAGNLGLMRSSDHGDTWEWLIASDVHEAIEGKNGRLYITTFYSGVRRSDSTWKEWETVSDGLPRDEYGNIRSFAIATDPHGVLYCSVYIGGGLYRSRDGGDSWEQVLSEEAPILDILIVDENLIVLATNGHGVLISEDSGENWSELNDGLTNWTILHLHIDHAGYLYAASMGSGLYRSRMSLYPCSRSLILSGDEGITGYSGLTI